MDKELRNVLKSATLLLVDDDARIREKFSRLLELYVSKIYEAPNGIKALEEYKKHKPSFIITDIEMPGMDGLEFIEIIRKENEQIPVIISSAYSNKEYLLTSIKLQLIDYLIKPINHSELLLSLEKIAKILRKQAISNIIEINYGVVYNPLNKTIIVCNVINKLTINESELLELLIINRGKIVTKEMVENKIYIEKEMGDSALKNLIYKLRKKLIKNIIISVDRIGYKID
jgi:DNA-binding response OmpR family regulator